LPDDSDAGIEYVRWMNLSMAFARENRSQMLATLQEILEDQFVGVEFEEAINVHHNYCVLEEHLGEPLWIHRKGAIRAQKGDIGIIPGAMGTYSFIVKGKGNPESFNSCSHGAGRHLSRKDALKKFEKDKVLSDLKKQGVHLGTDPKSTVVDEAMGAYKDIEYVMKQQVDLVEPIKRLKTIAVVKG
jgi:tRNA-splicing ligase RtcB